MFEKIISKVGFYISILKKKIEKYFKFYKGLNKTDLLIYDDIFPHPISGFRYEEFTQLLEEFDDSKIIVNPESYKAINSKISEHTIHVNEYLALKPKLKNKIFSNKYFNNINSKLFYCVFLGNIYNNIEFLEKFKIPFVFTLYPGGGFQVNSKPIDRMLDRVFSSSMFRKVIVTQKYTKDYLIDNSFCNSEKIEFIFGCVVPQSSLNKDLSNKKFFKINKESFDIVFCAARYTDFGEDKGYDTFIELAKSISIKYSFIRFHVIGGFDESVIDIGSIKDSIKFYGYKRFKDLSSVFLNMDVIISPNKPFVLRKGAFDGFPLGTVVEASLNGVIPMVADELNENTYFKDGEDIIIIKNDISYITDKIESLISNPAMLKKMSNKVVSKFSKVYSNGFQMNKRIDILQNEVINYTND